MSVELRGKVRARDRETSWAAASLQTDTKTAELQVAIRTLLHDGGPATDEEIQARLETSGWTVTGSGVRTRRHELLLGGWVADSGDKRRGSRGSPMTVWRYVRDDEPAPEPREPEPTRPTPAKPDHRAQLAAAQEVGMMEHGIEPEVVEALVAAYLAPRP